MRIPITVYERVDHLQGRASLGNFYHATKEGAWIEHCRGQSYLVSVV